jgi:hypothetical protein
LSVVTLALLFGCSEDTITTMPSEGAATTEEGTQSLQPAEATGDLTFAKARAKAVPLILEAEDELDKITTTSAPGSDLGHVSRAADLVEQAADVFDGVDDEIAGYLHSAADHLIGAMNAIGGSPKAAGATGALHAAADDIDAAYRLLG